MVKKGSVHILGYNKNFENDSNYETLPEDFDAVGYQSHMAETKGKPTRTVRAFFGDTNKSPMPNEARWDEFKIKEELKNEFANGLKEELNIVNESVTIDDIMNDDTEKAPKIKPMNPLPKNFDLMSKSQIAKIGSELGIEIGEDMFKRDMITKLREFFEEKKKVDSMKKINNLRFPSI